MRQVIAIVISLAALGSDFVGMSTERVLAQDVAPARVIEIVVDGAYSPDRIVIREGEPVRLRFVRHEYSSCTREVVFPWRGLRRELPPHQPVTVDLPALAAGEYAFHCGMNMVRGTIVVQAR